MGWSIEGWVKLVSYLLTCWHGRAAERHPCAYAGTSHDIDLACVHALALPHQ
jgi:hypothetical protein